MAPSEMARILLLLLAAAFSLGQSQVGASSVSLYVQLLCFIFAFCQAKVQLQNEECLSDIIEMLYSSSSSSGTEGKKLIHA